MRIFRVSGKHVPDPDIPVQHPAKPRAVRVIKAGHSINTRIDAPDRPMSARKVVDHLRKSNIDAVRERLLDGLTVKQWQAKREIRASRAFGELFPEQS